MKIVVVGIGKVGRDIADHLAKADHEVVVVDNDREDIESAINSMDVMAVCGNGASYDVLKEAGVSEADLMIATTSSDEVNILACFIAKKLGTKHTIARIRNREYEKQLHIMREDLGLSMILNPENAVSREITRVLRYPNALKINSFSNRRIEMLEYRIEDGSPLIGRELRELGSFLNTQFLICVVERDDALYIPDGYFVLNPRDKIYLTAEPSEIDKFLRRIGILKERVKNVMMVGASTTAFYLARELENTDMKLTIIDQDESLCVKFSESLPKVSVVCGDATDSDLLTEEGIEDSNAFIALTGLDETNIILSMFAKEKKVDKVITKINKKSFANILDVQNKLDTVVSTPTVTSEIILQYISSMRDENDSTIKTVYNLIEGRVSILEFRVSSDIPFVNTHFRDLQFRKNILIAAIIHSNGQIIIPNGNDMLVEGDDVLVVTMDSDIKRLNDILK